MKKTTIRPKTLEELRQFYQEALNPRYCIRGIYHIKLSNWFAKGSPITKTLENTLNVMFERITPVEYKTLHKDLTFNDFFMEYKKQHDILAEIKSRKYKESKAKKEPFSYKDHLEYLEYLNSFMEQNTQETQEAEEEIQEQEPEITPPSNNELLQQNNLYLKRIMELLEENQTVKKRCIENSTAYQLKMLNRLVNIENLLTDYLK